MYTIIRSGDIRSTISGHKPAVCITHHHEVCDIQEMELIYSVHDVNFGEQGLHYTGLKGAHYTGLRYLHRMICLCTCLRVPGKGVLGMGDLRSSSRFLEHNCLSANTSLGQE